jgi:hypothetical protein
MHRQASFATLLIAGSVGFWACGGESPRHTGEAAAGRTSQALGAAGSQCQLPGAVQHVIYLQFDNVHFRRDNPNVPSDLEQMPHLLSFLTDNGTLLANHHTPLISHTADDIVTSLTGVYPARHGEAVANSYAFFTPPGSKFFDGFASSFTYWTDPVNTTTNTSFNVITPDGKNAPAPWVPYTRAGCNVGAVSTANIELENIRGDINTVFGPTSPEAAEAKATPGQAVADFEGIAVHCAAGDVVCSANHSSPDLLPDEPNGYTGFSALYGHKYVAPAVSATGQITDLDGNVIPGFPGFGGISASQSLGYVAAMQEHGIPVTYAYISDAHDDHVNDAAFGPGEAGYVAQLAAYDHAFDLFFQRLAADGITKDNTLFVITSDENDHFAGGPPTPANCDGINVPCTYAKIGEIDANITALLNGVDPSLAATPFDIHFDMVPTFYIKGNQAPGTPVARAYERAAAKLTATSPITGNTDQLTLALADFAELKLLHMVTGDPQRTPSFVMFGDADYFFLTSGTPTVQENPGFAWNHGGFQEEITHTWLGIVGPDVQNKGVTSEVFTDHTDIRPTVMELVGLTDDYVHDGRVITEVIAKHALPQSLKAHSHALEELSRAYKAINASVGPLSLASLKISTAGLASGDATSDTKYQNAVAFISEVTQARDALAQQIITALNAAEFQGVPLDERQAAAWTIEADLLVAAVEIVAATF